MKKYFSFSRLSKKFVCLSSVLLAASAFNYSNVAFADVEGIPSNPDFPNAQYPYAQAPNGCSGPWGTSEVRDTWGSVNFTGACNTHDQCYYTYGSNWNTCNERFYSDLRAACERDLRIPIRRPAPTWSNPSRTVVVGYGPPEPIALSQCYRLATGYYAGVQAGVALDVFNEAQDKQRRYEEWVASLRRLTVRTEILPTTVIDLSSGPPPVVEPPRPTSTCLNVDSRQGWQSVTVNHGVASTEIGGGWSVDTRSYSMVSYGGHEGSDAERLAPFNAYKYDQRFPFGALLMDVPEHGVVWVNNPSGWIVRRVGFPAGATFRLRINDADNALGDNGGALRVCLVPGIG